MIAALSASSASSASFASFASPATSAGPASPPRHAASAGVRPPARAGLLLRHPALARIEAELRERVDALATRAPASPAAEAFSATTAAEVRAGAKRLGLHLRRIATQLWPMWRDLTDDVRSVDTAALALQRLCAAVDELAATDAQRAATRLARLAEPLRQQQQRTLVLLRALQAVVPADRLDALGRQWAHACRRRHGPDANPLFPTRPEPR